jgi:hypothetical protein
MVPMDGQNAQKQACGISPKNRLAGDCRRTRRDCRKNVVIANSPGLADNLLIDNEN